MRKFKPNTTVVTAGPTINGKPVEIPAEAIPQTDGCLVATWWDGDRLYGITHVGTGMSVTGDEGADANISELAKRTRRFWRSLNDEQRAVWKTSTDSEEIRAATPPDAIAVLRREEELDAHPMLVDQASRRLRSQK